MKPDELETISIDLLAHATGGAGAAGFDMSSIGPLIQQAGQMADQFGAKGQGSAIASKIGPMIQQFAGMAGSGGASA